MPPRRPPPPPNPVDVAPDVPTHAPGPLDAWPDELDEVLLTQVEFAERIKRSARQVHNLADAGMPVVMRGDQRLYPWPRALHWVIEARVADGVRKELAKRGPAVGATAAGVGVDEGELLAARARLLLAEALEAEAKAERAVIAVQRQRGELVDVDFMVRALEDRMRPIRAALQNLPGRWQAQFVGLDTVRASRGMLERLARDTGHLLAASGTSSGAAAALDAETPLPDDVPSPVPASLEAPAPSAQKPARPRSAPRSSAKAAKASPQKAKPRAGTRAGTRTPRRATPDPA